MWTCKNYLKAILKSTLDFCPMLRSRNAYFNMAKGMLRFPDKNPKI